MSVKLLTAVATVTALIGLSACGGGGGSSSDDTTTSSTRDTSGAITGFGSVFVNGVEYETGGAEIQVEGRQTDERQLRVGMVVRVRARVDAGGTTGVADSVEFTDELEGLVLANAIPSGADAGTLDVMGQTVKVTADTVFDSELAAITAPDLIQPGHIVEVSGYPDGQGEVYATRIEVKDAFAAYGMEVKGRIADLNAGATDFRIGDLIVDYSAATEVPGSLADGLYVEIHCDTAPTPDGGLYRVAATRVELERQGQWEWHGDNGEEVEVTGIVTDTAGLPDSFELNGRKVLIGSGESDEDDELEVAAIQPGARVEVEGRYGADGLLVAHEVESEEETDSEYEGAVEAVDAGAGTVTVLGQTFRITTRTRLMDDRDDNATPEHYFNLERLSVGDYVEIQAATLSGERVATELKRDDSPGANAAAVEGLIEGLNPLVIAGIEVDTGAADVTGSLDIGLEAEASGTYQGGVLSAARVDVE